MFRLEDNVIIPYSSGTTGVQKGVMLSHKNYGAANTLFSNYFDKVIAEKLRETEEFEWYNEHMILLSPIVHVLGFAALNIVLTHGCTGILMKKLDVKQFMDIAEKYKVFFTSNLEKLN